MVRATTPQIRIRIKGVDLTLVDSVYVTIRQVGRSVTVDGNSLSIETETVEQEIYSIIEFYLEQDKSLDLVEGNAEIQVNWLHTDNGAQRRDATECKKFVVTRQLLTRLLP